MENSSKAIQEKNYLLMKKEDSYIIFSEQEGDSLRETGRARIDWNHVAEKFIRSEIPTEAEIEWAINYIEDELMSDPALVNHKGLNLYTDDKELIRIFHLEEAELTEYTKEHIEEKFTQFALLSMGRSPVYSDKSMNHTEYLALLVIREILNHLGFESLRIIQ